MADFTDEFADSAAGADDDFGTSPADLAAQLDAEEAALDDSDDSGSGDGDFGGDDGGDFGGDGDGGFVGAFVSDDDDAYSSNDGDSGDSDDDSDDDRNLHVRYGYHGLKGKRKTMEDDEYAHAEVVKRMEMDDFVGEEIETVVTQGFFGVYDGHGGSTTAHFLAEHLHVNCAANPGCYSGDLNEMTDAIRDGCEKTENDFMEYALKSMIDSGSTAVLGVVAGNALVVANVGDSEAILCRKGVPRVLSTIHNPKKNADEEQRVVDVGGRLFHKRVAHPTMPPSMCSIAVSRAFGDLMFKDPKYTREAQSGLTAEPSFEGLMITPNDEFLLLACDGVWDVLSYEDAIGMVSETLRATDDPKEAAKYVCEQALAQGSADNITAMVVVFDFVTTDRLYELWAADEEIRQRPPDTGAADAAAVVIYPVAGGEPYQGDAPWAGAYRNNPGFRRSELYRFPLLDYNDMVGSLDTQQFIQQQIRADPADFAAILDVPPHVTSWVWQYEHLRQVALELNHLAVMLDGVCTADTCPKMMATDEWMFLCAAHEDAKECSAVDYILHTLDGTAALLNNTKHFPNRSSVDSKSKQFLQSVARRLYRINAHAYFHHREVFDAFEEQTHLTERFGILVNRNKLIGKKQRIIPTDFWVNGGM